METAYVPTRPDIKLKKLSASSGWPRVLLLAVLGYEAAGCLTGGALLIMAPDGHLMDMPVSILHGVFNSFLVPGIILFFMGLITTTSFLMVLRRKASAWIWTSLALGGLLIWFWVEIAVLQQLHWLHLMWGLPVLAGAPGALSLFPSPRKTLLVLGFISSVLYIVANVVAVLLYSGYSPMTQTVSELSAIGAPTRAVWVAMMIVYSFFVFGFGWGIRQSASDNKWLKITGTLFMIHAVIGLFWPPMHQRELLAAQGGSWSDDWHIAFTFIVLPLMMLTIGFGAAAFGKRFRFYSIWTLMVLIVAGVLTGMEAPQIKLNGDTPTIGLWERINIGVYMVWLAVLSLILMKRESNRTLAAAADQPRKERIIKTTAATQAV